MYVISVELFFFVFMVMTNEFNSYSADIWAVFNDPLLLA